MCAHLSCTVEVGHLSGLHGGDEGLALPVCGRCDGPEEAFEAVTGVKRRYAHAYTEPRQGESTTVQHASVDARVKSDFSSLDLLQQAAWKVTSKHALISPCAGLQLAVSLPLHACDFLRP
jgi:hypothetical protein